MAGHACAVRILIASEKGQLSHTGGRLGPAKCVGAVSGAADRMLAGHWTSGPKTFLQQTVRPCAAGCNRSVRKRFPIPPEIRPRLSVTLLT